MFATLVGHEIWPGADPVRLATCASGLADIAERRGYQPSQQQAGVVADQAPLNRWRIALLSPGAREADFLLAAIQPEVPTIAPLPCQNPTDAPMFAVIDFAGFYVVSSTMNRDIVEFETFEDLERHFEQFLDVLPVMRRKLGLD